MAKKTSDTIYSLDNVRNVVKNIAFSAAKKETAKMEREAVKMIDAIEIESMKFFDALVSTVPKYSQLAQITSGYTGAKFRKESLYASPTMLRALAGAYHELVLGAADGKRVSPLELKHNKNGFDQFTKLLNNLNEYMDLKIYASNGEIDIHPKWRQTTLFRESGLAPQSGFQDLAKLVDLLTEWGRLGDVFAGKVYGSIKKPGA
jgi:hypothetical protein